MMRKGRVVQGGREVLRGLYPRERPGERAGSIGVFRFLEGYNLKVSFEWFCAVLESINRANALEVYQDGLFTFQIKEVHFMFRIVF